MSGSNGNTHNHTHTFCAKAWRHTPTRTETPSSVIHYYQKANFAAASPASSEIPCSILWSEHYRIFCSADTKDGFSPDTRLAADVQVCHKGSTVDPALPPPLTFHLHQNKTCFFLWLRFVFSAAGVLQQTAQNQVYSGWSQLQSRHEAFEAAALAPEIDRLPWERCREGWKTPASPSSQTRCPT